MYSQKKATLFARKRKCSSRTVIVLDLVAKKLKLFVISVKLCSMQFFRFPMALHNFCWGSREDQNERMEMTMRVVH